jgi:hypothetical protein
MRIKVVVVGVVSALLALSANAKDKDACKGTNKKEFQQRLAAGDPDAAAREKACSEQKQEKRANFGPYIFTTHASAQTIRPLIVKDNLKDGYTLEQETAFTLRFAKNAPMPVLGAAFMIPSACTGLQTRKVWTYTLVEQDGVTTVTVQPMWEYPGDYCRMQTHTLVWNVPSQRAAFQALLDSATPPVK